MRPTAVGKPSVNNTFYLISEKKAEQSGNYQYPDVIMHPELAPLML
jgi:hypothetical protein